MEMAREMSEETRKKMYKRQTEYNKNNCTHIGMKFHNVNDADILEKLESVISKQGYIKELIRLDIEKNLLGK